jgi:hypothetical protein
VVPTVPAESTEERSDIEVTDARELPAPEVLRPGGTGGVRRGMYGRVGVRPGEVGAEDSAEPLLIGESMGGDDNTGERGGSTRGSWKGVRRSAGQSKEGAEEEGEMFSKDSWTLTSSGTSRTESSGGEKLVCRFGEGGSPSEREME